MMIQFRKIKFAILLLPFLAGILHGEAYFKKDSLLFTKGNGWIPTQNLSTQAIQFVGNALVLDDNTIIDSENKDLTHYIAPMIGAIMAFSMTGTENVPDSWLVCDGSEIKKTDYPLLYSAIGDSWGVTIDPAKFKLPDLRNNFIRGLDDFGTGAANIDTDARKNNLFTTTITSAVKIGSYQKGAVSSHSHSTPFANNVFQGTPINPSTTATKKHSHTITNLYHYYPTSHETPDDGMSFGIYAYEAPPAEVSHGVTSADSVGIHTHTYTFSEDGTDFAGTAGQIMLPKRAFLIYCIKYEPI